MKIKTMVSQIKLRGGFIRIAPLLALLSFIISGSSIIPDQDIQDNVIRNKKIDLLEKLENGSKITSDEIRSSFRDSFNSDFDRGDSSGCDRDEFGAMEMKIKKDLNELKEQMDKLKNSDEFENAKNEFRKGMDQFRREMDRMRDEFRKNLKESKEKSNSSETII